MKKILLIAMIALISASATAQDTTHYSLRLGLSLIDLPQNKRLVPSMTQSLELSNNFYELSYYGIYRLDRMVLRRSRFARKAADYALGLGFAYYGSELPIPFGVWAHEEFHRSVLSTSGIHSKNGNWIGTRWDGTVFGVSDQQLTGLKKNNPSGLLYSYVAGVQYETMATKENVVNDFFFPAKHTKAPLYLYNAWYVWNYFRFSTGALSDSVKIKAPEFESRFDNERDFAGADLTAWANDMFTPDRAYTTGRTPFPNGEGVNRRIGYSDLSSDAQRFLSKQRTLSLINFINPAIFMIERIKIGRGFSFNVFGSYQPTHFGNSISVNLPMKIGGTKLLVVANRFSNKTMNTFGAELATYDVRIGRSVRLNAGASVWSQPKSYLDQQQHLGGAAQLTTFVSITGDIQAYTRVSAKTNGWIAGNPYLDNNAAVQAGIKWNVIRR